MSRFRPFPHQLTGAEFLADRPRAYLADEPRVGKTGAALIAADYNFVERILVVTTASGRAVWQRAFTDWPAWGRQVQVVENKTAHIDAPCAIVAWSSVNSPRVHAQLLAREWDCIILDEAHFAKSFDAARTRAVYGEPRAGGREIDTLKAIVKPETPYVWLLSGTPAPNSPADLYPMLRALAPERLGARGDLPDVTTYDAFMRRYCVVRYKKISNFRKIPVVVGGRNLEELRARIDDFTLRRTQADIGITEPIYETFPLAVSDIVRRRVNASASLDVVLRAAERSDTRSLEIHLGQLKRMTGEIKARAVVEAVRDDFDGGLDKIVLAYWHRDVGDILADELEEYGVARLDGSTPEAERAAAVEQFNAGDGPRVFLAQIQAAGEAIDLSAASLLLFVETSFVPAHMKQMSLRVTNLNQSRQPIVRVAALAGSLDEAVQEVLMRKWATIREVLS